MIYLSGVVSTDLRPQLDAGRVGLLVTPRSRYRVAPGWTWAADNGCFAAATYVGDAAWWAWLEATTARAPGCLFAVAPDVVGDHAATWERSAPWLPRIRALGVPAAYVAQDGLTPDAVPWHAFDVLFVGGSTAWKLGPVAARIVTAARARGVPVHFARVNSGRRFHYAAALGATSCDGTFLAFGPTTNLPRLEAWLDALERSPMLPVVTA